MTPTGQCAERTRPRKPRRGSEGEPKVSAVSSWRMAVGEIHATQRETGNRIGCWGDHFQVSGLSHQEPGAGNQVQVRVQEICHPSSVIDPVIHFGWQVAAPGGRWRAFPFSPPFSPQRSPPSSPLMEYLYVVTRSRPYLVLCSTRPLGLRASRFLANRPTDQRINFRKLTLSSPDACGVESRRRRGPGRPWRSRRSRAQVRRSTRPRRHCSRSTRDRRSKSCRWSR